ncbi:hypothetical protein CVT26_015502 [Gymnopilus dilepis]|uniref:Uncharacterized protein n=1 Tax=Gymnopilus dilepis TaxID=231916 RepID=A0A409WA42_9AGAR|nr:hypothetical protein CVT26_015502 [Gymnopilus dilepis]
MSLCQLDKIRKMMQLANDSGSTEAEAKVAMRRATRMMKELNITQADLIAHETDAERSARAGHSTVTIFSTLGKMVRCQQWHERACDAIFEAFDVQFFSENHDEGVDWVFYGLAENTVAAALSFEMLHNQIETWAVTRKKELKGRSARSSYCNGVAERVLEDMEAENRKALKQAEEDDEKQIQKEKEEEAAAHARLAMPDLSHKVSETTVEEPKPTSKAEEENRKTARTAEQEDGKRDQKEKGEEAATLARLAMPGLAPTDSEPAVAKSVSPSKNKARVEDVPDQDDRIVRERTSVQRHTPKTPVRHSDPCLSSKSNDSRESEKAIELTGSEPTEKDTSRNISIEPPYGAGFSGEANDDDDDDGFSNFIQADFDRRTESALDSEFLARLELKAEQLDIKVKAEQLEKNIKAEYLDSKVGIKSEDQADVKPTIKVEEVEDGYHFKAEEDNNISMKLESDVKQEQDDSTIPHWTSAIQLRTFRDNAKTIAENYLKDTGIKLYKVRQFKGVKYNWDAYGKGWEDGRKVDLKRRKIEQEK